MAEKGSADVPEIAPKPTEPAKEGDDATHTAPLPMRITHGHPHHGRHIYLQSLRRTMPRKKLRAMRHLPHNSRHQKSKPMPLDTEGEHPATYARLIGWLDDHTE